MLERKKICVEVARLVVDTAGNVAIVGESRWLLQLSHFQKWGALSCWPNNKTSNSLNFFMDHLMHTLL